MLKIFVFIDIWFIKVGIQKWLKTKLCSFFMENLKMKRKNDKKFWPSGAGIWTPDFQSFSRPWFEFSWEVRRMRSNQNKLLKKLGLYLFDISCSFLVFFIISNIGLNRIICQRIHLISCEIFVWGIRPKCFCFA